MGMNGWGWTSFVLLMIGGLSIGIEGFSTFDLIGFITFGVNWLTRTVQALIGISAITTLWAVLMD